MLLIFVTLAVFAILCTIATVGAPEGKPLSPWRRRVVLSSRWLGKVVVLLLGFWVKVKGWENYTNAVKHGTRIIVFNHPSWVDSILLLYLFAPSGVSRQANLKIPVVGRIIWSFQNIYVSASTPPQPQNADAARSGALDSEQPLLPAAPPTTTQQIQDRLSDPAWPMVAIAPEGMTTNGKQLLRFRTGAFAPAAPVLPVCISYQWKRLNPAWTICNEPWHIVRLLTQFVNFVTVEVLPAHSPSRNEAASATTFAANVRQSMSTALDVPTVQCGISEYHELMKLGLTVNWRGKLVEPEGVIDDEGCVMLRRRPPARRASMSSQSRV